jgi:hypothetical protein
MLTIFYGIYDVAATDRQHFEVDVPAPFDAFLCHLRKSKWYDIEFGIGSETVGDWVVEILTVTRFPDQFCRKKSYELAKKRLEVAKIILKQDNFLKKESLQRWWLHVYKRSEDNNADEGALEPIATPLD